MKVGFIGAGGITEAHARALKRLPGVEIAAWASRSGESAAEKARRYGGEAMELLALLDRTDIQAVLICTPTSLHKEHVLQALQAGKKVFCEKPLARSLSQARDIIAQGEGHIYVGHVLRFFHEYSRARKIIQRGDLGEIQRIVCRRLNCPPGGSQGWFDNPEQSGGVVLDLLIHDFDWLLWTLGGPRQVEVIPHPEKDASGWRYAVARLHWDNHTTAEVEGSWMHDHFEHYLYAKGEKGYLRFDMRQPDKLTLFVEDYKKEIPLKGLPDPYEIQMAHFIGWLQGLNPPIVTLQEAQKALVLALQVLEAQSRKFPKASPSS
ncbi:MAG: gfo/Idh/MocA family oxidoreductase [Calditrichaeota bacterium]|nr:MAG: gfo/Idh/MocA family oxidoreductase [Calditrichota bacterium]